MSNPITNREQGSVIQPSQASRITDSTQTTDFNQKRLTKKKESTRFSTKTDFDVKSANEANKPLTRSRAKIIASQESQLIEINPLAESAVRQSSTKWIAFINQMHDS